MTTSLTKLWAGPETQSGAAAAIAEVESSGLESDSPRHELQALRRESGRDVWRVQLAVPFEGVSPRGEAPAAAKEITAIERARVQNVARDVMTYLDGAPAKGFVAGKAVAALVDAPAGTRTESRTVLWVDNELGLDDAIVTAQTDTGILALVSARRLLTTTSTNGKKLDLGDDRVMFQGHNTTTTHTSSAVTFALLYKGEGDAEVIAADSAYVIPGQ